MAYITPTHNPRSGIFIAALATGPITVGVVGLGALASTNAPVAVTFDTILGAVSAILVLIVPAAIVALLPLWLGTELMLWMGRQLEVTRLPVFWALIGAAMFAIPAALVVGAAVEPIFACGAIGAACALVCRIGAAWDSDEGTSTAIL